MAIFALNKNQFKSLNKFIVLPNLNLYTIENKNNLNFSTEHTENFFYA